MANKKEDLENRNATELAVMCQKIADNPSMDEATATKARNLKHEWTLLAARGKPADFKANQQLEKEKAAQKARMVEFLMMF